MNTPQFKPFEEKIQEAIDARLQAERVWMEFVAAVAAGRITESLEDICERMKRQVLEDQRREQQEQNGA